MCYNVHSFRFTASSLKSRSLGGSGEGGLRAVRGNTVWKMTVKWLLSFVCVTVYSLQHSHRLNHNFISSLPSFLAGIVVIYMAQVQPDSNMTDICYYSEIFFSLLLCLSGGQTCKVG